eukprot:3866983-Rhodomonas_salina.1
MAASVIGLPGLDKIKADLGSLNWAMSDEKMVPIAKKQLFTKWEVVYKEQLFAKAFAKVWQSRRWTSAEANAGGDGGVPSDNNCLKAKNCVIKKGLRRELPVITSMLPRSLSWLIPPLLPLFDVCIAHTFSLEQYTTKSWYY